VAQDINRPQGRISRFFDLLGRAMIATGLLMLSFVAYQLWGTGFTESRAQDTLASQFVTQQPTKPQFGGLVGRISIPSINLSKFIVAGVRTKDLERGPGLFPGSPLPGQLGNVAIAGHRTTFGAPFSRIDEIHDKEKIILESKDGTFTYIVDGEPKIVSATDTAVAETTNPDIAIITLVSCYPKWTSRQRIIVVATLDSTVSPLPPTPLANDEPTVQEPNDGWFHDSSAWPLVVSFAGILLAIATAAITLVRLGRRAFIVYPIAFIIFVPFLFLFFTALARLLPANL
jgi:sortase A